MSVLQSNAINPEYIKMRWQEPYVSGGLNAKTFGVLPHGIYHGFSIVAGPGSRQVQVTTDDPFSESGNVSGYAGGNYDSAGSGYSIAVFSDVRGLQTTIQIPDGVSGTQLFDCSGHDGESLYLILKPRFDIGTWTDAYMMLVNAAEIALNPWYVVIGTVNVPANPFTAISSSDITYREGLYPRTEPWATQDKWGFMNPKYVRKIEQQESLFFHKLTGGGVIALAGDGNTLSWTDNIFLFTPGRVTELYITPNSIALANGEIAYVIVPQTSPGGPLQLYIDVPQDIIAESVSGVAVPIFVKDGNRVYAASGTLSLEAGEDAPDGVDSNISGELRSLLGVGDAATQWGFTNNFSGLYTDNAVQRWSKLDVDDENLHEDRNLILKNKGKVVWDAGTSTLTWQENFVFVVPNEAFDWTIVAGTIGGIADGNVVYATVNRASDTVSLTVCDSNSLPLNVTNKNHFVLGYRSEDKFIFRNGYVWQSGQNSLFQDVTFNDPFLRWDAIMNKIVFTGEIEYLDNVSGQVSWDGNIYIRSLTGRFYITVDASMVTLADQNVGYLDLIRDIDVAPKLTWTNGSAVVTSIGAVAWTSGLTADYWIKKSADGINGYYKILSIDSPSQVTLSEVYAGTTSSVTGDKSVYALGKYTVTVAHRKNVPTDVFWLFYRDDFFAPKGRISIRDIGELGQGEKITTTNWVYEESFVTDSVSGVGTLITLPNDTRNLNLPKYYRSGSGDIEVYQNGIMLLKEQVPIVTIMSLISYNSGTGYAGVPNTYDVSRVFAGDIYEDVLGNQFEIKKNGDNSFGAKTIYLGPGLAFVDTGYGAKIYRQEVADIGNAGDLVNQVKLKKKVEKDAILTFRLHPINRPYSDGAGSGPSIMPWPEGVSGTESLQDAYDLGNIVYVLDGFPVTFVGTGLIGKTFRVLGDMEVTGMIDPSGVALTPQGTRPGEVYDNTMWMDLAGNLMFEDTVRSVQHTLTEQGKFKKTYTNNTGALLRLGRVMCKNGAGQIKYGSYATELESNVIGILMQQLANTATGFVQRGGWIEGALFDTTCFIEGVLPTDGVQIWLAGTEGKMTVSGPTNGSGFRALVLGIWDDGGLLWQVRDFGIA